MNSNASTSPRSARPSCQEGEAAALRHGDYEGGAQIRRFQLRQRVVDCLLPVPPADSWQWMKDHGYTKKGVPFNYFDYPWVKGIAAAWDDPSVKRIFFMAGSRLGKTETGLSLMQSAQDHNPDVGMIVGPTETIIEDTIGDRFWSMLEKSPKTRWLCPSPHRRAKKKVKTPTFVIYGAWSGSPTTLGDKDPKYLQLFEIDKFTKDKSEEADPFLLAMARGEEIPDRKLYAESTPTIEGQSRVADHVFKATNRRFQCPCPHCGHHQELVWNEGTDRDAGGLWWDRDDDGTSNPNRAAASAVYICAGCKGEIKEEQRREMVRKGVWCAEGQTVDGDGQLHGRPVNDGPDESFHLSRLYGPTFSFSDCARAYVEARDDTEKERSFENNWRGMPWRQIDVQMQWEDLAKRLCVGEWSIGIVPKPAVFVTTAIDVQLDHFVLSTFGWDRNKIGYLVQHGSVPSWEGVREWILRPWPHEDGRPIRSLMNLIDSKDGNRQEEVFSFCKSANNPRAPWVWPLEGAKYGNMAVQMFKRRQIDGDFSASGKAKRRKGEIEGVYVVSINTRMTQNWLDNAMYRRKVGVEPMSIALPQQVAEDQDLFEQLLNERFDVLEGKHVRIDETVVAVDLRDTFRYSRAAAEVYTNGNWARLPESRPQDVQTKAQRLTERAARRKQEQKAESQGKRFIRKPTNPFLKGR